MMMIIADILAFRYGRDEKKQESIKELHSGNRESLYVSVVAISSEIGRMMMKKHCSDGNV